jgi:hypothetical protein
MPRRASAARAAGTRSSPTRLSRRPALSGANSLVNSCTRPSVSDRARPVGLAPLRVLLQQGGRARIAAPRNQLGERGGVAQAEIEPLAGHRMDAVGGVARKHDPAGVPRLRLHQLQRIRGAAADLAQSPQAEAERGLQRGEERGIVERQRHCGLFRRQRPDDRHATPRQRQHGQWPAGRESLEGSAAVLDRRRDIGDQCRLPVVADLVLDVRHVARRGVGAVGGDQQARADRDRRSAAARDADAHVIRLLLQADDFSGRPGRERGRRFNPRPQRGAERAVFDDLAEARQAVLRCPQARRAERAPLRYVDLADRRGIAGQRGPAADALENPPAALGHCGGAIVIAGLRGLRRRRRLDDQRVERQAGQRHC